MMIQESKYLLTRVKEELGGKEQLYIKSHKPTQIRVLKYNIDFIQLLKNQLNISRVYTNVNFDNTKTKYDRRQLQYILGNEEDYEKFEKIGEGLYSKVYRGIRKSDQLPVALKCLKKYNISQINREILMLNTLHGQSKYIVEMVDSIYNNTRKEVILVYKYMSSVTFRDLIPNLDLEDIKLYMYQLLLALDKCHSLGIMHRDLKTDNIIIDHHNKILQLIDWGLSEFYIPEKGQTVIVGQRSIRAPELYLQYQFYDYSLDMWSFGCILSGIVFKKVLFFEETKGDYFLQIVDVLGTEDLDTYIKKYNIHVSVERRTQIGNHDKVKFKDFRTPENFNLCSDQALDLISKILIYDHFQQRERLTAKEAMSQSFFDSVRKKF